MKHNLAIREIREAITRKQNFIADLNKGRRLPDFPSDLIKKKIEKLDKEERELTYSLYALEEMKAKD